MHLPSQYRFTCILISRFMLNLRQVARRGSGDVQTLSEAPSWFSTVRFSPDVVGDLGAPLGHDNEWAGGIVATDDTSSSTPNPLDADSRSETHIADFSEWEEPVDNPLAIGLPRIAMQSMRIFDA
ncbi:hypothetical protein C8Q77DRAFT_358684 [Trametes polyzona]|nr:hypothetical protein C8Q77DRAFT_358684 [Trametes polyzona]